MCFFSTYTIKLVQRVFFPLKFSVDPSLKTCIIDYNTIMLLYLVITVCGGVTDGFQTDDQIRFCSLLNWVM